MMSDETPPPATLYVVIPCYNESKTLPLTLPRFSAYLKSLVDSQRIAPQSRLVLVDDGSKDDTWSMIADASREGTAVVGVRLSRNFGHQGALLAGLMEAREHCDIAVSADADGQDDIEVMGAMVDAYLEGHDIVYGVRSCRDSDKPFKRFSARAFYKIMNALGAQTVEDHADYRLLSKRALDALAQFDETNLFLRGIVPLIGLPSTTVPYVRNERLGGESHYRLSNMVDLALTGITGLSAKPLRFVFHLGTIVSLASLIGIAYSLVAFLTRNSVDGWTSIVSIVCFLGGMQMLCLGIIGEYVGKAYIESKRRPRYIISETTDERRRRGRERNACSS